MTQGPLNATIATQGGAGKPAALDATGNLLTGIGITTTLGIVGTGTVVSLVPVRIGKAVLQVAGSTATLIYDATTTTGLGVTTQIASLSTSQLTPLDINWPCLKGLVVVPGTGATVAVSTK